MSTNLTASENTYVKVDNSGNGNCLFYAYAQSLIHYLWHKNNDKLTNSVLNILSTLSDSPLSFEDRATIETFIKGTNNPFEEFRNDPVLDIAKPGNDTNRHKIEAILNAPLRELAASQMAKEFGKPNESEIIHETVEYVKNKLNCSKSPNVIKIKFPDSFKEKLEGLIGVADVFLEDIPDESADDVLAPLVIDFFTIDNNKNFKDYVSHIKKNYEWGGCIYFACIK